MPASLGLRVRNVALLIVALFAMGADVCILPMHVHASDSTPAPVSADTHHRDDGVPDHALHTASCEALRLGPIVDTPILAAQPFVSLDLVPRLAIAAASVSVPSPTASPPLFLLHASLLI
jgi:hypothetical protein